MEIDPKEFIAFVTLVLKHEKMLVGASHVLYNQSVLLEAMLPKCYFCDKVPFVVRHKKIGMGSCERCAAERIVSKTCTEADWVDVVNANEIRELVAYVDLIRVAEPPVVIN